MTFDSGLASAKRKDSALARRRVVRGLLAAALALAVYAITLPPDLEKLSPFAPILQLIAFSIASILAAMLLEWTLLIPVWLVAAYATTLVISNSLYELAPLGDRAVSHGEALYWLGLAVLVVAATTPAVLYWRLLAEEWRQRGRGDRRFIPRLVRRALLVGAVLVPVALGFAFLTSSAVISRLQDGVRWSQAADVIRESFLAILPLYYLGLAVVGTTVMLGLHWRDRMMQERIESEERARLQRDAHDKIYNRLSALSKRVVLASAATSPEVIRDLAQVAEDIRTTVVDLQDILGDAPQSRTQTTDPSALASQLAGICDAQAARLNMQVTFSSAGPAPQIPPLVGWDLRCVAEEALTNSSKHGKASKARVSLHVEGDAVTLEILDNGHGCGGGIDIDQLPSEAHGLRGMRSRLARADGRLDIVSVPGETRVVVTLPLRGLSR